MSGVQPAYVTVLRSVDGKPANKRITIVDGKPEKQAIADQGKYLCSVLRADTPEALAAALQTVGGQADCLLSLGYIPSLRPEGDDQWGPDFRIISRRTAAKRLQLDPKTASGVIDAAFGTEPRPLQFAGKTFLCVTRTKGFFRYGGWMLFDRDPNPDMPDDIAHAVRDDEAWLAGMAQVSPALATAGRVRLRSSTGRVLWKGKALPSAGAHEYIRVDLPDATGQVGKALFVSAALKGLTWSKPSRDQTTGEVVARTQAPIWDSATFSVERLVFVGAPVIEGPDLTIDPPRIEVFAGPAFAVDQAPEPDAEDLAEAARKTGASFSTGRSRSRADDASHGKRDQTDGLAGPVQHATNLTMDTVITFQQFDKMTVWEACRLGVHDERAQVPDAFRSSSSWNAMFWQDEHDNGQRKPPVLFDRGARVLHSLTEAALAKWEGEFLLPPLVDAPPPPAMLPMAEAGRAVASHIEAYLAREFEASERRIALAVWKASWDKGAKPPAEFLPRPDPLSVQAAVIPPGGLELLRSSTSTGKSQALAQCSVAALQAKPTVRGLRRRIAVVAKDHRIANELAETTVAAAQRAGSTTTVSRYRGMSAKDPSEPEATMCRFVAARLQAHKAGLSSNRACRIRVGEAEPGSESDGRYAYCRHHPMNPERVVAACGYESQDLSGDIVIFAGWGALRRAVVAGELQRHVTLTVPATETAEAKQIRVPVQAFDALVIDETDMPQLLSGAATEGGDDPGEDANGGDRLKRDALPPMLWPGMLDTAREAWAETADPEALADAAQCEALLRSVYKALVAVPDGGSLSPAAMAETASAEKWQAASVWAWKAKEANNALVKPNQNAATLKEALDRLRSHNQKVRATATLLRLIGEMVEHCPTDTASELVRVRQDKIEMRYAAPLGAWASGMRALLMDGTGDIEILKPWWPDAVVVADIVADWAPSGVQHVVAMDYAGAYASLTPGDGSNPARVTAAERAAVDYAAVLDVMVYTQGAGNVMLGGPKDLLAAVAANTPETAKASHLINFGGGRGLNIAQHDRIAVGVGRPLPPSTSIESNAALLRHGRPVADEDRGYIVVPSFHRMRDGTARAADAYGHKDPLANALLAQACPVELEQNEDRTRKRRRDDDRPLLQMTLAKMGMGDRRVVDTLTSANNIRRVHPEALAAARGLVVDRSGRGALSLLTMALDPKGSAEDLKAAAGRVWKHLRRYATASGLWEQVLRPTPPAEGLVAADFDLVRGGWIRATRQRVALDAIAGRWWQARVQLPGSDTAVPCAAFGADQAAAAARLVALIGDAAAVTWAAAEAPGEAASGPGDTARPDPAPRAAAAGGGVGERARAMIAAGAVPLSREHARAMYPGLFATPAVAWRAIEAARRLIEAASAKVHNLREQGEIPIPIDIGISPRTRGLCTFGAAGFSSWQFRLAGKAAKRLATVLIAEGFEERTRAALVRHLGEMVVWRPGPARQDSSTSVGGDTVFHPVVPSIDTPSALPPVLHPPLPGEDLQPSRPPPVQPGLLGVIPGQRAVPVDLYPEPGSFEPNEEDLLPVQPGTPLPAEAPRAWWFELQRRKAAVPLPDMSIGWPANHFREERWKAAVAAVEAAWDIEWQAAWVAGSRLPPAEEGTTT